MCFEGVSYQVGLFAAIHNRFALVHICGYQGYFSFRLPIVILGFRLPRFGYLWLSYLGVYYFYGYQLSHKFTATINYCKVGGYFCFDARQDILVKMFCGYDVLRLPLIRD